MRKIVHGLMAGLVFLILTPAAFAQEEENEVKPVPYSQIDPTLPHPAHEGARITLKAMIREANCGSYQVRWDTNNNGDYNDEFERRVDRNAQTNSVLDIGRNFRVPDVPRDMSYNINVRVQPNCNGQPEKFATFRLFIYDFSPSPDPRNWTDEQIEIMSQMAVQENLWYTHRTMGNISGSDSNLKATDGFSEATALSLWAFTINGHLPAYPPDDAFSLPGSQNIRPDWFDDNSERWHNDPYAETAMRYANWLSSRAGMQPIANGEETNECGYNPNGTERVCQRIGGTADNQGGHANHSENVYRMGVNLGGLAIVLPALAGTPLCSGAHAGQTWEWYI
jgi:hypothetical protein